MASTLSTDLKPNLIRIVLNEDMLSLERIGELVEVSTWLCSELPLTHCQGCWTRRVGGA